MKHRYVFYPAARIFGVVAFDGTVMLFLAGVLGWTAAAYAQQGQLWLTLLLALCMLLFLGCTAMVLSLLRNPDCVVRVVVDETGITLWKRRRQFVSIPWSQPMYISFRVAVSTSHRRGWVPGDGPFHVIFSSDFLPTKPLYDEAISLNYADKPPAAGEPWRLHCCCTRRARAERLVRAFAELRRNAQYATAKWHE